MANALGYKEVITWQEIQNPYIPLGMVNAINNNALIQGGMANLMQTMMSSSSIHNAELKEAANENLKEK